MTNDQPYDSDLEYIEDELEWIELRCKRIITKRLVADLTADDEAGVYYNQSYYHHDQSLEALIAKRDSLEKQERHKRFGIDGRLAATRAEGRRVAVDELVELYQLDNFDRTVLLLAASVTFSRRFQQMYGRIWDGYEALVVETVFSFCELPFSERITHFKRFSASGLLFRNELVTLNLGARIYSPQELLDAQIRISNRTFDFIVGDDHFMDEFMEFSSVEEPRAKFDQVVLDSRDKDRIRSVVQRHDHYLECRKNWGFDDIISYGKGVLMLFYGKPGTGKTMMAHAVAHEMGMRVLNVDIPTFINHYDAQRFLPGLFREAKMQNAVLFFDECEALFATRTSGNPLMTMLLTEIERFEGVAILATNLPQQLDEALDRRILVRVNFPEPDRAARRSIWEKHLPQAAPVADDVDLDALAEQFEMTGGYIKNAVLMSVADAVHRGGDDPQITMESLETAAREQATPSNEENSPVFTSTTALTDVVLPEATSAQLAELVSAARSRRGVLDRAGASTSRRGLTALFSGPSGTGKSMSVRAVAAELNRPIRAVSVGDVVSDWASSRDAIEQGLLEAHSHNAVLALEHADALLEESPTSKWLAAELERHDGVVILTADSHERPTLRHRLDYIVEFARPDHTARAQIWRQLLPTDSSVDIDELAAEEVVGAEIERAVATALFRTNDSPATSRSLIDALSH